METKIIKDFGIIRVIHPDDTNVDELELHTLLAELDVFGWESGSNNVEITANTKKCGRVSIIWENSTPEYFHHEGRQVNTRKFLDREREVCTIDCPCIRNGVGCKYVQTIRPHDPDKCYCPEFFSVVYPNEE